MGIRIDYYLDPGTEQALKGVKRLDPELTTLFGIAAHRDLVYQNLEKELVKIECQKQ